MIHFCNRFYWKRFLSVLGFFILFFNDSYADTSYEFVYKNLTNSLVSSKLYNYNLLNNSLRTRVVGIDNGYFHTCLVNSGNSLYCWGGNGYGQLGDDTTESKNIPAIVLNNVIYVSADYDHTCAIDIEYKLYCWGSNWYGQLGDGTGLGKTIPKHISNNFLSVSTGFGHTCAISGENKLYCWGYNTFGQLGDGTYEEKAIPTFILDNIISVSSGDYHTCAIDSENKLYCWGENGYGQIGDGTNETKNSPTYIMDDVASVSAGYGHTCAIDGESKLYCWGHNESSQLGDNTNTDKNTPVSVYNEKAELIGLLDGLGVTSVSAGSNFTCAINSANKLFCWGRNNCGQLGDGTIEDKGIPTFILNNVTSVSVGNNHTCAVIGENRPYCWGSNDDGQLGDGTNTSSLVPNPILGIDINDCSSDKNFSLINSDCNVGLGLCSTTGKYYCDAIDDKVKCDAVPGAAGDELCNGLDDDCDGSIDENFDKGATCTVGIGACKNTGVKVCSSDYSKTVCNVNPKSPKEELCNGIDDDCDGVIDNNVILINNQCYKRSEIANFDECNLHDSVVVKNRCYKLSDYNTDDNELNGNIKPLPPVVTLSTTKGKIEILMEKYTIGNSLKKKLQKNVFKKYGVKKAKLKVYYEYVISPIKDNINLSDISALAKKINNKKTLTTKRISKNRVAEKDLKKGSYKIQYRIVIQAVINKKFTPVQSNKLSDVVKFAITGK